MASAKATVAGNDSSRWTWSATPLISRAVPPSLRTMRYLVAAYDEEKVLGAQLEALAAGRP